MAEEVHLISAEQASYLDAAFWTRRADEPLPPCPVCDERPTTVRSWHDLFAEPRAVFVDCGHVIGLDIDSLADWYATADTNPWVGMFEALSRQQRARAAGEG